MQKSLLDLYNQYSKLDYSDMAQDPIKHIISDYIEPEIKFSFFKWIKCLFTRHYYPGSEKVFYTTDSGIKFYINCHKCGKREFLQTEGDYDE